jgi:enoyl-CoA hydratase
MMLGQRIFNAIEDCSKPSIAAVNGYALGGGCELAMCCDIRIASENAKFGQPEIKLGNIPGWGGTQRLPRLIGKGRASQMIFTGEFLSAADAEKYGLVNTVTSQDELLDKAIELAKKIASMGPIALKMAKIAINEGLRSNVPTGLKVEAYGVSVCLSTEDQKEGVNAFFEKRPSHFKGK